MIDALSRSLQIGVPLSAEEQAALARLDCRPRQMGAHRELNAHASCVVVHSGIVCSYALLPEGRRTILAFHVQDDVCNLEELGLPSSVNLCTLTPASIGLVSRADLLAAMEEEPGLAQAVWRRTLADGLIRRQWMISLGRRDAYGRAAHLLCELLTRYEAAGLAQDDSFELAITQEHLADALGLSIVHVNRVMQRLRAERLIETPNRRVKVLDRDRLETVADFDPAYLQPKAPTRVRPSAPRRSAAAGEDGLARI